MNSGRFTTSVRQVNRSITFLRWISSNIKNDLMQRPTYRPLDEVAMVDGSDQTTIADIVRIYYAKESPVILRNAVSHFPATKEWNDHNYLLQQIGSETLCDIEIGPYNRSERVTIPFEQYITYLKLCDSQYNGGIDLPKEQILYLAQNDLPHMLQPDIEIPSFCTDDKYTVGEGKLYSTMLWMGPVGCLSPLHFDPLDNLLMQIIGRKQVYLIDKKVDSSFLYVGAEFNQQSNTSAVENIDHPNLSKYQRLRNVTTIFSGTLNSGDLLFIPSKWWHAMKSLDFSISVNAWWR